MNYSEIQVLIEKYLNGQATEEEKEAVDAWYNSFDPVPGLTSELSNTEITDMQKAGLVSILNKLNLIKG